MLTLTIPVTEAAKPRQVAIAHANDQLHEVTATSVAD